jgi:hypothetical protein
MLAVHDVLDAILLGCFFFGLIFAAASLLSGLGGAGHLHLPLPGHVGHGHLHLPHHDPAPVHAQSHGHGLESGVSPFNTGSLLAFVSWFGGWAYLTRNELGWIVALSLLAGLVGGLIGGGGVFLWLAKVLIRMESVLDPDDYRLPGTLARVTSSIRVGGCGEIVYEQGGVRQVSAARSFAGPAIARGTEVVVRGYEHGIAAVEPWDDFLGERHRDLADPEPMSPATHPPPAA